MGWLTMERSASGIATVVASRTAQYLQDPGGRRRAEHFKVSLFDGENVKPTPTAKAVGEPPLMLALGLLR